MVRHHIVVPYPGTNSTVRTRALHWIERCVERGEVPTDAVVVHGPGFAPARVPAGESVLLVRNARRLTRGGSERTLLARASLGVYDLDDGLPWDDGDLPGLGRWWKRPFPRSRVARTAADAADRVIVGNAVLGDWAARHCRDVRLIPTCVEPSEYDVRSSWSIVDHPVIGWIGSPATELYLWDLAKALREVHRRTGAVFEVISGPGELASELREFTRRVEWSPTVVARIATWDVGIMPLRDGIYERAKCGYKLLQYAASGVPAVGSPVGVNASLLSKMDGLAASTDDEWVDALCQVLTEPCARRGRRAASGLGMLSEFSYDTWHSRWVDAVGW